jgi:hypothetical protein
VEVFHSGAAGNFNINLTTKNILSSSDPRNTIVNYDNIPGSLNYTAGIDQIEDIPALTDNTPSSIGNVYINFMPYSSSIGTPVNNFLYLVFLKIASIYTTNP